MIKSRLGKRFCGRFFSVGDAGVEVLVEERFDSMIKDYNKKPEDLNDYKKQLKWRARNLGMKEMDLLVSAWTQTHLADCDREESLRFERQILNMETPDLFKLVFMPEGELREYQLPEDHFLFEIREFALTDWNKP